MGFLPLQGSFWGGRIFVTTGRASRIKGTDSGVLRGDSPFLFCKPDTPIHAARPHCTEGRMGNHLKRLWMRRTDENGAAMAEYVLLASLVVAAGFAAVRTLGSVVVGLIVRVINAFPVG